VRLRLDPGQGRLLGITIPGDLVVTAHGPSTSQNFERSPLRYDGGAGAFIDYFSTACHALDLTYGPDNRLYVLDEPAVQSPGGPCTTAFAVRRFNGLTGAFEEHIDEHANYVAYSGYLSQPNGLAFGPDGNLYISNGIGTGTIVLYQGPFGAAPGEFITVFADLGNVVPTKLRFGPDGDLYVIGSGTGNVLRLQGPFGNAPGALVSEFVPASSTLGTPSDLAFGPDRNLYVASFDTAKVLRYAGPTSATPGQFLGEFATGLLRTAGIAFGPENDLFVSGFSASQTGVFRYDGNAGTSKGLFASVRTTPFGGIGPLLFSSSPLESADLGDYNGDRCVDRSDLTMLLAAINRRDTNSIYDLNGDGPVNIADSRKLTLLFTNPQGASCGGP
jgi:sugar lactone lactonase YvrE